MTEQFLMKAVVVGIILGASVLLLMVNRSATAKQAEQEDAEGQS